MSRIYELQYENSIIKLPLSLLFSDIKIYRAVAASDNEIKHKGLELFEKIFSKYNENVSFNIDIIEGVQFLEYLNEFIKYNDIDYAFDDTISFYENYYNIVDYCYLVVTKSMIESLKKLNVSLPDYKNLIPKYNISEILQPIQNTMLNFEKMQDAMLSITKSISEIFKPSIIETMHKSLTQLSTQIANTLASINFPSYTDEQKERINLTLKIWGKYGWCIIDDAPLEVIYDAPISFEDANNKMSVYYSEQIEKEIFEYLELRINSEYFKNAIELYSRDMYLSCAMALFALIDFYCINVNSNTNKKVGFGAIKCLDEDVKQSDKIKDYIYLLFDAANLISCLYVYFDNTENFTKNCEVINRNYVMHGMHNKNVDKLESKKLFLLLYSLLKFEDNVNEMGGF